jgi:DNA repair protein RecO (recombination protein O)
MLRNVQGIVLRSMDYGEGNKIISVLTAELGKVSIMARGAKKSKSRYAAATQVFTHADFVFFKQKGHMGTLNHADIIDAHHALRVDLSQSAYSAYLVEMTDRMLGDEEGSAYLFGQLKAGLSGIESNKDMQIVVHLYEMKMFELAGYLPVTANCVSCGAEAGLVSFSPSMGGVLCIRCKHKDPASFPVTEGTLKLLKLFPVMDMSRLGAVNVKAETKEQLKICMKAYMDTHIGINWKSRGFIEQMDKYGM